MQQGFADMEYTNRKRKTKRDKFLEIMEEVILWGEWCAIVEPYYPNGKRGCPPRGVEAMLRMYLLSTGLICHTKAPTSTKNADMQRDPEMHQVKKGEQWHFGERIHVGCDAGTSCMHALEVTAANVSEREIVPQLVRGDDEVLYGDAGYTGLAKRSEFQADAHLSSIDCRVNTRNRFHLPKCTPGFDWELQIEYQKSRVRRTSFVKGRNDIFVKKAMFAYSVPWERPGARGQSHRKD